MPATDASASPIGTDQTATSTRMNADPILAETELLVKMESIHTLANACLVTKEKTAKLVSKGH